MDHDWGWPWVICLAIVSGLLLSGLLVAVDSRSQWQRDFEDYRQAVELCTTLADSGEELRACVKEAP